MTDDRWAMTDGRWAMGDGRWAMGDESGLGIAPLFCDLAWVKKLETIRAPSAYRDGVRLLQGNIMTGMRSYKELDAWRLSMTLVETTYRLSKAFPDSERYGLSAQMQRSSVSIPSNIAEGQARGTTRFGLWYLRVAIGSSAELETQVELARRLGYVTADATSQFDSQLHRVRQLLYGMRREHERRLGNRAATVASILLLVLAARFL